MRLGKGRKLRSSVIREKFCYNKECQKRFVNQTMHESWLETNAASDSSDTGSTLRGPSLP